MSLGAKISARLEELELTQADLIRRTGLAQSTINGMIRRGVRTSPHLILIAKALETTPEALLVDGEDRGVEVQPLAEVSAREEQLPYRAGSMPRATAIRGMVPVRQIDLAFGMGATYLDGVPVNEVVRHFPAEWLRQYTKAPAEKLVFAEGVGDSMMPTLMANDLVLIDCSQETLRMADQIWAVSYCGLGMIKRLRPARDGGVRLMSDNAAIEDLTAYDDELQLIGRVVAVVRKV